MFFIFCLEKTSILSIFGGGGVEDYGVESIKENGHVFISYYLFLLEHLHRNSKIEY